jgi:protein SCO1
MTRASDGRAVSQADYRGKVVLLYFGYTFCPDVCPTTLSNLADVLTRLGADASNVRVLFVTVDPGRDTLPILAEYTASFGRQVEGLRGTPDQLAALARRYRILYSVRPETKDHPYEVTHSSAIYVFDRSGSARLLVPSLSSAKPDVADLAADLRRLTDEKSPPGFLRRLLQTM